MKKTIDIDAEYIEIYKRGTDYLFNELRENKISIKDETWAMDGFVKFRVEEAPGWLFGIWWKTVIDEEATRKASRFRKELKYKFKDNDVVGEVFGQYEEEIDKFRPSYSEFCEEINYYEVDDRVDMIGDYSVFQMIQFIIKEPYLAYYKELKCVDYNKEYVRRDTAKKYFEKRTAWRAEDNRLEKEFENGCLERVKKLFDEQLLKEECFIRDCGKNCTPRYDFCLRLDGEYEDKKRLTGGLSLEDLVEEGVLTKEGVEEYRKYVKDFQTKALEEEHIVSSQVSDTITVYHPQVYWDKKELNDKYMAEEQENE